MEELKLLTNQELRKLFLNVKSCCAMMNQDSLSINELSNLGREEALHMELLSTAIWDELKRREGRING